MVVYFYPGTFSQSICESESNLPSIVVPVLLTWDTCLTRRQSIKNQTISKQQLETYLTDSVIDDNLTFTFLLKVRSPNSFTCKEH